MWARCGECYNDLLPTTPAGRCLQGQPVLCSQKRWKRTNVKLTYTDLIERLVDLERLAPPPERGK